MKIHFLGTSASEGIPAVFCRCPLCGYARTHRGKDIRRRTAVLIDGKLLVDFSPDAGMQSVRFDYDYTALDALFITHTHCDHFALDDLIQRFSCNSMNRMREVLQVYANSEAVRRLDEAMTDEEVRSSFSVHTLSNMQSARVGEYTVTAFRSVHMDTEESLIYLFSKDGKNYLHVVDSAEILDCVYDYLLEHRIKLDAVALDCTFTLLKKEYFGHMNFTQNRRVKDRLTAIGAVREDTRFVLMHISHFAGNTHEQLEQEVRPYGFEVAYDGLLLTV